MKFLLPTDFSKNADNAINYAIAMARATQAELVLLHIYTPQVSRRNVAYALISEEVSQAIKAAGDKLNRLGKETSADQGIVCSGLVLSGSPVQEIVRHANSINADLIIMGTQGVNSIDKIFFGSNTASVIERSKCNVLAIPTHTKPQVPKKIVFATDYHTSDLQTMKKLARLASLVGAEIVVLHVSNKKLKSERDMLEQFTKEVAKDTGLAQPYYYVMSHKDTRKGIELFVDSTGADLLSMSTRRRSAFSKLFDASLTKQIASQAHLPLLAFHVTK